LETKTEQRAISTLAQLQAKLSLKAKLEPKFRFYTLYGHLHREDVLQEAWKTVKKNGGAPGIDNISIKDIENSPQGVAGFLQGIQDELINKKYHPKPVKREYIPKSDGQLRPLGIPTVKDRVVQAALRLIIEPIFEEDFLECSYGFRPEKSAHQAISAIKEAISTGKKQVYDADLKGYFDSIPHDKLMKAIERRIADRQILKLILKWFRAPIWEPGKSMKSNDQGTPQGGVISPLLANIYLHWFDKIFNGSSGPGTRAKAVLVRYADDFVVIARYVTKKVVTWIESTLEGRFGLSINREKTKIVDLETPKGQLDFLGFSMRWTKVRKDPRKKYCSQRPSKKSLNKAREEIREITSSKNGYRPVKEIVKRLNEYLRGWGQYFSKGQPSEAFESINYYADSRMYHFMQRRSQKGYEKRSETWYQEMRCIGVIQLTKELFR
jgi:RNA-directed DNA polymerase